MAGKAARQPAGDLIRVVRWLVLLSGVFLLDVALTALLLGAGRTGEGAVLAPVLGVRPREPLGLVGLAGARQPLGAARLAAFLPPRISSDEDTTSLPVMP